MDQSTVRRAGVADAAELTRLRVVMFEDMGRDPALFDAAWRRRCTEQFAARLADRERFAAFVVDWPGGRGCGLAACAAGWVNDHLVGAYNPIGRIGYLANVSTDRDCRRRGHALAVTRALLDWLRGTGIGAVDLHATPEAEPLYRSLGFADPVDRALTLRFARPAGG
jgi:ribosomal protein S18 acetylase RimI-like enzyme